MSDSPLQKQTPDHRPDGTFAPGNSMGRRWRPGESGNPGGFPAGGCKPGRWIEAHAEATIDELQAVADDPKASASARASAMLWLDTAADDPNVRRNAWRVLLDRAEGRPAATVTVKDDRADLPEPVILEQIRVILDRQPDLRAMLAEANAANVEADPPPPQAADADAG